MVTDASDVRTSLWDEGNTGPNDASPHVQEFEEKAIQNYVKTVCTPRTDDSAIDSAIYVLLPASDEEHVR